VGKPYVFGAEAALNDPDPPAFDCSELVQWACARVGVKFPDGTWNQIAACKPIEVGDARTIMGALVFKLHKQTGECYHVGISDGHGQIVEAKGKAYGVVETTFRISSWQAAGLIRELHSEEAVQAWVELEIDGELVEGANVYLDAEEGYSIGKLGPIAAVIGVSDGGYPDIGMPVAAFLRSHGYTVDWKPKAGVKGRVVAGRYT
jgi:hypothetical protein